MDDNKAMVQLRFEGRQLPAMAAGRTGKITIEK